VGRSVARILAGVASLVIGDGDAEELKPGDGRWAMRRVSRSRMPDDEGAEIEGMQPGQWGQHRESG
jgi:hypothetical protein